MKQKILITVIFILILHTNAELTENVCQSLKQRDVLTCENRQRNFQYDMLNAHNILREQHCVPPLILDDKISENAQAYADYLADGDKILAHSDRKGHLGENLYSTTTSNPITNPNGEKVTQAWYNEFVNYNFDIPGFNTNTGHFTQIVWKDTKKLGIGIAFAREGRKMYVVAQYSPPGNYRHAFKTNVLPVKC